MVELGDDGAAFLARYDAARFPHPSLAVDVVLLTVDRGALRALLIRRAAHPFAGTWTLPGGFVGIDEALDAAAARVLRVKVGLEQVFVEQLHTFGDPGRDPRTRIVSVAYIALVDAARAPVGHGVWAAVDASDPAVVVADGQPLTLGFDHAAILAAARARLRSRIDAGAIGAQLLPSTFTLRQLQDVHEAVLGQPTNKDSFRRRMLATGQLEATGAREGDVGHRPAELYRFVRPAAV